MNDPNFKMAEDYYFDTSIWLDIYEKRGYNGEIAKKLMEKIIKEGSIILYSDFTIREFKNLGYLNNEIHEILSVAKPNNLKMVHRTKEQILESIKLAKQRDVPVGDAIHAVLSRDHNAQLISRDLHYSKLKDITKAKTPEELL